MKDPIDILGVHPSGAFSSKQDPRKYIYGSQEIPRAAAPFDWSKGYDLEADIAQSLGLPGFQLTRKNQGPSGSCGGQGMSAYQQAIAASYKRDLRERSAKYVYSQVYVPIPGGGSAFDSLANIAIKQGFGLESLTPSYDRGTVPTEAFMERPGDITGAARLNAANEGAMLAYAYFAPTIDAVAAAMQACKGVSVLLRGSNNGTWLSAHPKPPTYLAPGLTNSLWAHYMLGCKAFLMNGVKTIGVLQSWGPNVGDNSIQWLDEAYFNSGAVFETGVIIYSPKPIELPHFTFNQDLTFRMTNSQVLQLQTFLAYDGCLNVAPTGYYGPITEQAVLKFQLKYQLASPATLSELGGSRVGPATRAKLNSLLS